MLFKLRSTFCVLFIAMASILPSCKPSSPPPEDDKGNQPTKNVKPRIQVSFNEDSAYNFVAKQVAFGPRVPGTKAHQLAMMYMLNTLIEYTDSAYLNSGDITLRSGRKALINNIIGSFNPGVKNRIVLAAHWDTRPVADQDTQNQDQPIDGANDGASGVGVLLEIARQLHQMKPEQGIDIIFFDQEDNGDTKGHPESWCLGSQYWAEWVKDHGYRAKAGILLDMVGAKNATFAYEGHSVKFNQPLMLEVWKTAQRLGYGGYFINFNGGLITDDHVYMSNYAEVPTIDIIHHDLSTSSGFPSHWHTHADNMDIIDKNTLKAVGHSVLDVVANWK